MTSLVDAHCLERVSEPTDPSQSSHNDHAAVRSS